MGLFGIILFIIWLIPIAGIGYLVYYIIKKRAKAKTPDEWDQHEAELLKKVLPQRKELVPWSRERLETLSNGMEYSFAKVLSQYLDGTIMSQRQPVIVFSRMDHGLDSTHNFSKDGRIIAASDSFVIRYNKDGDRKRIYFDSTLLGTLYRNSGIYDSNNRLIGSISRNSSKTNYYELQLKSEVIAHIMINDDQQTSYYNVYHRPNRPASDWLHKDMYMEKEVIRYNSMIKLLRPLNEEEYTWALVLTVLEIIDYGIDFRY